MFISLQDKTENAVARGKRMQRTPESTNTASVLSTDYFSLIDVLKGKELPLNKRTEALFSCVEDDMVEKYFGEISQCLDMTSSSMFHCENEFLAFCEAPFSTHEQSDRLSDYIKGVTTKIESTINTKMSALEVEFGSLFDRKKIDDLYSLTICDPYSTYGNNFKCKLELLSGLALSELRYDLVDDRMKSAFYFAVQRLQTLGFFCIAIVDDRYDDWTLEPFYELEGTDLETLAEKLAPYFKQLADDSMDNDLDFDKVRLLLPTDIHEAVIDFHGEFDESAMDWLENKIHEVLTVNQLVTKLDSSVDSFKKFTDVMEAIDTSSLDTLNKDIYQLLTTITPKIKAPSFSAGALLECDAELHLTESHCITLFDDALEREIIDSKERRANEIGEAGFIYMDISDDEIEEFIEGVLVSSMFIQSFEQIFIKQDRPNLLQELAANID